MTRPDKLVLAEFIAARGENFAAYEEFARSRGWTVFTPSYLHTWVQRHRDMIRLARAKHQEEIRKVTVLDKEARVKKLERNIERLETRIQGVVDDVDLEMKLIEQQRKLLQAIAQERGEWGHDDASRNQPPAFMAVIERMMQAKLGGAKDEPAVDGVIRELPEKAESAVEVETG